ncbi:MAG: M23 family metallopeptidase [Acidimicrobiia bacterium]|nr:M23 family metallopeptidase [Acidimicrobiia bacterium]MDH4362838.1 M23 family metallopeptidase [Acidimicrobiia bacterium]
MPIHALHLLVRFAGATAASVAWLLAVAAPGAGSPAWSLVPPAPRPDAAGCPWIAPVDAPVVDGFRAPPNPYGPGNRGLEYGVTAGQPVVAVAAGRVGFVGPVAGRRYVVVEHPGGVRSTYGPLASTAVVGGQQVAAGEGVGEAAPGLLLTARLGSGRTQRYIDPAPLLAGACGRARLIPDRPVAARTRQ